MKKSVKPDVVELIDKVRQEIAVIDRKIDALISKSSPRPVETKPAPKQGNGFRERVLYKAICADCRKECEVPFKPSGERPVYCKECFSKRKSIGPFKARSDNKPAVTVSAQAVHADIPETVEKKRPAAKKKQVSKKKKR